MSVIHSRMPLATLPQARLQNGQVGYNDVLAVPAANASTLADYVDGLGTYGAPLNPSGEPGHDHSGGLFGKPMFITLMSSTLHGEQGGTGVIHPLKYEFISIPNAAGGVTNQADGYLLHPLWIPGCDLISGAYVRLGARLRVDVKTTSLQSTDTLQVVVKINDSQYAFTVTNPHTTGKRYIGSASTSELIGTNPGATNVLSFQAKAVRVAGGSNRGCDVFIEEIELGVFST